MSNHLHLSTLVINISYSFSIKRSLYGGHWGMRGPGREPTDWRFEHAFDRHIRGSYLEPHIISFSAHGLYPDESTVSKIARSEILVAADIMRHRLKMNVFITNDIYPVLYFLDTVQSCRFCALRLTNCVCRFLWSLALTDKFA